MFWRVEPFLIWPKELTFLEKWVKYLNPFWKWLKELIFFHIIPIIEPYFEKRLTELNFLKLLSELSFFIRKIKELKELNPSCISLKWLNFFCWTYDSKNLNIFFFSIWLKELLQPFFFMFQILGPFSHDSKNWTFFFLNLTQRIVPSFFSWLQYLDHFFTWLK